MVSTGRRPELILNYPMEDDYLYLEGHEPHCDVMGSCCDECLKLNGFDIDETLPPVTLEDVIEANKRMLWKPQPFN